MAISLRNAVRPFIANPVVTRDLRVRMRGSKAFWHQAVFLLMLGLLAVVGYSTAVGTYVGDTRGVSIVEAQSRLQQFYYFIFETLAAMVCLIAPGLTAASITSEKQRLTMDLLVTTPMTSGELLIGKLISSTAFLLLLLAISLPASALCIILGGATISDVFQAYVLLAIDGLLLATFGVTVSCSNRANLPAIIGTYVSVAGFLILTAVLGETSTISRAMGGGVSPWVAVSSLNPFVAVAAGVGSFQLFGLTIPVWVGTGFLALLIMGMAVTAASYRLGNYGGNPVGALRLQWLFFTGLMAAAVIGYVLSTISTLAAASGAPATRATLEIAIVVIFVIASLHLPSLFTPVVSDGVPGGDAYKSYSPLRAFSTAHSGSLPFFHLWLVALGGGILVGIASNDTLTVPEVGTVLMTLFYLSGFGFLFWSAARRASTLARSAAATRPFGFAAVAMITIIPAAIIGLSGVSEWQDSKLSYFWVLYPMIRADSSGANLQLLWSGIFCYALGTLLFPFWRRVAPAGSTG